MASPTARIVELERLYDVLDHRMKTVERAVEKVEAAIEAKHTIVVAQGQTCIRLEERIFVLDGLKPKVEELGPLKAGLDQMRRDIEELKDARKTATSRWWAVVPAVVGGVIALAGSIIVNSIFRKP